MQHLRRLLSVALGAVLAKISARFPRIRQAILRNSAGQLGMLLALRRSEADPARFYRLLNFIYSQGNPKTYSKIADRAQLLHGLIGGTGVLMARLHLLNRAQRYAEALQAMEEVRSIAEDHPLLTPARMDALFHEGRNEEAAALIAGTTVDARVLRDTGVLLAGAVAATLCKQNDLTIECFGRVFDLPPEAQGKARADVRNTAVWNEVARRVTALIGLDLFDAIQEGDVGVLFHNMPHILGHALHEPFFALSLFRQAYKTVYIVGDDLAFHQPGPKACMDIVNQYCRYVPTRDPFFHQLAHTDLGGHARNALHFHAMTNWTLTREVVLRTRDPHDPFRLHDWSMSLPERFVEIASRFCAKHGIDLEKPIVTLHARDDAFHGIARQSIRNSPIASFVPAINWLLQKGWQVIRLGDPYMPRLDVNDRDYFEIPYMEGYVAELDAFFVKRSRFMVASASGPLAYAIALRTPVIVVNAILNYMHATAATEMNCLKRYKEISSSRVLPLAEAVDRNLFSTIHLPELERAGFTVEESSAEEVLAAVEDMNRWVDNPALGLTSRQLGFREKINAIADDLLSSGQASPPLADFVGQSLPFLRISPTVAELRNDFA
ncbi:MAG TPA: TIGR04372 family glycosyltransferase [Pseudolabrys sp.]|nr:TIGR04372 family glycosyltransferase [Pseudolabrys sp.]